VLLPPPPAAAAAALGVAGVSAEQQERDHGDNQHGKQCDAQGAGRCRDSDDAKC
jgi:hypothetical protein